jgi:predicted aspartyl protease
MPAYDATRFQPPAPLANVTLRNQETGATWTDVPMLLDTGADLTLVPEGALERLGIQPEPGRQYELLGFDGSTSFAQIVQLELTFLGKRF